MANFIVYLHGFDGTAFQICKISIYLYVSMNFLSPLILPYCPTDNHDIVVTEVPSYIDSQLHRIASSNTLDPVCKQAKDFHERTTS